MSDEEATWRTALRNYPMVEAWRHTSLRENYIIDILVRWQNVMAVSFSSMAYVNHKVPTNETTAKQNHLVPDYLQGRGTTMSLGMSISNLIIYWSCCPLRASFLSLSQGYIMVLFHPNCTLPPEGVKFVSAPNVRSTLDIVWSCLSILVICTWSVQYPNLPLQIHPQGWRQQTRLQLRRVWRKTVTMLMGILVPEVMTAIAIDEWRNARSVTRDILPWAKGDDVTWSQAHSFAANMGFFMIKFLDNEQETVGQARPEAVAANEVGSMSDDNVTPQLQSHELGFNSSIVGSSTNTTGNEAYELGNIGPEPVHGAPSRRSLLIETEYGRSKQCEFQEAVAAAQAQTRAAQPVWLDQMSKFGIVDWSVSCRNNNMVKDIVEDSRPENVPNMGIGKFCGILQHLQGNIWYVDATQLLFARKCGIISKLPKITSEQLNDRSKSDSLVIVLAVLQVLSFGTQLIVRLIGKTTSSPLEVTTLAVAVCTFVIYILLWNKPKDIATSIYVSAARFSETHELRYLASCSIIRNLDWTPAFSRLSRHYHNSRSVYISAPLLGMVFGCLHCIAWNFVYPTIVEKRLWQASSLAIITISALLYPLYVLDNAGLPQMFGIVILNLMPIIYAVARCFILVESIRSLAYLPPDAFVATWASNMPAIS